MWLETVSVDEIDVTTEYDGYYYTGGKRTPKIVVSYTDEKGKKTVFRQGADFEYLVHMEKMLLIQNQLLIMYCQARDILKLFQLK